MKRHLPLIILALGAVWLLASLRERAPETEFDVNGFGRLPVLVNGRIKPMDTVARSSLLQLQGRQRVATPEGETLAPIEWLLEVQFRPEKADALRTFEIVHPDLLTLFNLTMADGDGKKRFSYLQLEKQIPELERQSRLAQPLDPQARSPFQRAVVQLHANLVLYHQLKHSLMMPGAPDFLGELMRFQAMLPLGIEAVRARQAGEPFDERAFNALIELGQRYDFLSASSHLLPVPPAAGADPTAWKNTGRALLDTLETGAIDAHVLAYAGLGHAWQRNQPEQFNTIIGLYRTELAKTLAPRLKKTDVETRFNSAQPFYTSTILYVLALLLALGSWLKWPDILGRSAFWITALAFIATTAGIATRMWLEGRPPVTNLYSSALFVGWGSVGLCLILEAIYKNAMASAAAGLTGFCCLIIAHNLSLSGDTLEMMRAVLDSNFWLATHVIIITIGYSATFLAGALAMIYVLRGTLTASLDRATADAITRMVYGIICFATLFSLVGTVLGGIWADQSWGRFWGWDPKENGALIIVLWCAIILHARWGGLVKQRGLMNLAIFGNIVTSWSWFGTNMLGVGLHSYGFMDAAFWWLSAFIASQLAIIALGSLPLASWRSFRPAA
ncbi:MAG TPA: cytochrome c biogenesis protein CcsA [Opitutaceae bacterium]|nr:cytochrome c biogenesis protein CcsA [Opitutaceae bacterium]HRJ45989.1 cytochrome c biogenesis protein CcsA [Opitutaceae bacterium]